MSRVFFLLFSCIGLILLALAFSTTSKDGIPLFFFGAVILLCTFAVGGLRSFTGKTPKSNKPAILGALLGLLLGGFIGAVSGFGRVVIAVFNPGLLEQDFGTSFGAIGGAVLGAFLLALLIGTSQVLIDRRKGDGGSDSTQDSVKDR